MRVNEYGISETVRDRDTVTYSGRQFQNRTTSNRTTWSPMTWVTYKSHCSRFKVADGQKQQIYYYYYYYLLVKASNKRTCITLQTVNE